MTVSSHYRRALFIGISLSGCALGGQSALAQSTATAVETQSDEIIVTAQRREERLQDVPISVTALSADDAERFGVYETKNLQFVTPGLTFPEDNGTINPYIRGRGTNFSGPGLEGSVAVYIDDVYLQTQFGSAGLVDVSQLQVLKGPQGTLYGRNATGGAILITTNDPTHELEGHVEVGYGNLDTRHAEAVLNLPIGETFALRFAGGYDERDGYNRNVVSGDMNGQAKRLQFRGKALWEPTDDFKMVLKGEYQEIKMDYIRNQVIDGTNTPTGLGFYETIRSPRVLDSQGGENWARVYGGSLHLNYDGDKFSISSVTAYRHTKLTSCAENENIFVNDFDFCPNLPGSTAVTAVREIPNRLDPDAPSTVPSAFDKTFTTETRVSSNFDGMFNFMLGAAYQKTKARFAAVLSGNAFGPLIPVFDNHIRIENYAIYGEAYLQITDRLKLTAGGRFSKDKKAIQIYSNADVATAFGIPLAFFPATVHQSDSWNSFTPRVVLSYDTGPLNFYASYSGGFKSGGFNAPQIFPQVALKPEKIDGFEIGAKLRLLDDRLWLDLAAFHTKSKDIQVAAIDTSVGAVVQQNAATAKADGAEANIRFRATDGLTLQAGVAYLNSRFTSFESASVFDVAFSPVFGQDLILGATENLKGFPTTLSPKWMLNGSITYDFPLFGDWNGNITLSARYSSKYDFQAGAGGPQRYARQDSFTVVNLSGSITPPDERFQISWYVNNLFDEKYYDQLQTNAQTGSIPQGGGVYGSPALPRTYGMKMRVNF